MKRLVAAFTGVAFLLLLTKTASAEGDSVLVGAGTVSCGTFLEKVDETYGEFILVGWVQGYLSGVNVARVRNNKEFITLPDDASLKAFTKKYCTDYPLQYLYVAAENVATEIGMFK